MIDSLKFTVVVKKKDGRRKDGFKTIYKSSGVNSSNVEELKTEYKGNEITVHPWIWSKNCLTGKPFYECPLTPYYCSPRSESYFSM